MPDFMPNYLELPVGPKSPEVINVVIEIPGDPNTYAATVVAFDVHNDIAVLRIAGATARPLRMADPQDGASAAIVGYPLDGNLTATPGRVGPGSRLAAEDSDGLAADAAI